VPHIEKSHYDHIDVIDQLEELLGHHAASRNQ